MKTKTIFGKSRMIVAAIAIALIVAAAAVLVVLAQPNATLYGINVATDGQVNLNFYYQNVADGVTKAQVEIDDAGVCKTYDVDLKAVTVNNQPMMVATVKLPAAEMGVDVTVTPYDTDGETLIESAMYKTSVVEYGVKVLNNSGYATYHGAVKALLNYGTYASDYFAGQNKVANEVVENKGIYSRDTNPVTVLTGVLGEAEAPEVTILNAEVIKSAQVYLNLESSIEICVKYETVDGTVDYTSGKNIATSLFTKEYTIDVEVGGETVATVTTSVMDCLKALNANAETKNVATALYDFYRHTVDGVIPYTAECLQGCFGAGETLCSASKEYHLHNQNYHYEATAPGATSAVAVCSICGTQVSPAIPDSINYVSLPGQQLYIWNVGAHPNNGSDNWWRDQNNGANGYLNRIEYDSATGTTYNRIYAFTGGSFEFAATLGDKNINNATETAKGAAGRYLVLKFRAGSGEPYAYLAGYTANDGKTYSVDNLTTDQVTSTSRTFVSADHGWQTLVVDMQTAPGFKNYDTTVKGDVKIGLCMKFNGDVGAENNYVDIAYLAIADDLGEVYDLLGTTTVTMSDWATAANDTLVNTETGYCVNEQHPGTTRLSVEGNVYTYSCTHCAKVLETRTIDDSINYYSPAGHQVNNWASGPVSGTQKDKATEYAGTLYYDSENGFAYNKVYLYGGASFEFSTTLNNRDTSTPTETAKGSGKYIVMKFRVPDITSAGTTKILFGAYTEMKSDGTTQSKKTETYGNWRTLVAADSQWQTVVLDMDTTSGAGSYYTDIEGDVNIGAYMKCQYGSIDIAYLAVCDSWDEIASVVGSGNVVVSNWATPANDTTVDVKVGPCAGNHSVKLSVSGNVYTYYCNNCRNKLDVRTIDDSINYYSPAGHQVNMWASGPASGSQSSGTSSYTGTLYYDSEYGFAYNRVYLYGGGSFEFSTTLENRGTTTPTEVAKGSSGKFIVMKIRIPDISATPSVLFGAYTEKLSDGTTQSKEIETYGNWRNFTAADSQWQTIVLDMDTASGSGYYHTNIDGDVKIGIYMKPKTGSVDIAYLAVCDSWDEIASVVGSGNVVVSNWATPENDQVVNVSDMIK